MSAKDFNQMQFTTQDFSNWIQIKVVIRVRVSLLEDRFGRDFWS